VTAVILNGLGASVIWVAQGEYFSNCATRGSKGFYFGMFWSIYQGSQIFGSYFGSLLFKYELNRTRFGLVMSALALLAIISFLFIRMPLVTKDFNKENFHLNRES
jgi:uncharacterized membrane protein YjgN (DUF898 family)